MARAVIGTVDANTLQRERRDGAIAAVATLTDVATGELRWEDCGRCDGGRGHRCHRGVDRAVPRGSGRMSRVCVARTIYDRYSSTALTYTGPKISPNVVSTASNFEEQAEAQKKLTELEKERREFERPGCSMDALAMSSIL